MFVQEELIHVTKLQNDFSTWYYTFSSPIFFFTDEMLTFDIITLHIHGVMLWMKMESQIG